MNFNFFIHAFVFLTCFLQSKEQVLGIGDAVIDLLTPIQDNLLLDHSYLKKGGWSSAYEPSKIEQLIHTNQLSVKVIPGGSAANTIRVLAKLGEACGFYGCIGNDVYGELFRKNICSYGIGDNLEIIPGYTTSHILCLITPDAQRSFFGYTEKIKTSFLSEEAFANVKWVHLEAWQFRKRSNLEKIIELSKLNGASVSIDLSSYDLVSEFKEEILDYISRYSLVVFCNEDEIKSLTNLNPEEGCFFLQTMSPLVVVTQGSKGCLIGTNDQVLKIPTFSAEAIDTTAAGDYFTGGFLYGLLRGYPLVTCARIGNKLGSTIVKFIGSELPDESWENIGVFLKQETSKANDSIDCMSDHSEQELLDLTTNFQS